MRRNWDGGWGSCASDRCLQELCLRNSGMKTGGGGGGACLSGSASSEPDEMRHLLQGWGQPAHFQRRGKWREVLEPRRWEKQA